jgi:A/G-specific adenine glycosylase
LWKLSAKLVPQNTARDFQNAMMDLGALICTTHNPRCQICPVKEFCCARDPASLPRKRKRAAIVRLTESHSLSTKKGAVLLERCHHRWRGMWMLPPLKLDGLKPSILRRPIYVSAFPFTHHRVKLRIFRQPAREIYTGSQRWFRTDALGAIPIPSPHRRAINALLA